MSFGEFAAVVAMLFTIAVAPAVGGPVSPRGGNPLKTKAVVDHVADGDTIKVRIGDTDHFQGARTGPLRVPAEG